MWKYHNVVTHRTFDFKSLFLYSSEANTVFEENGSINDIEIHDEESTENTCLLNDSEERKSIEADIISQAVLTNPPPAVNQHQTKTFSSENEL